MSGNVHRHFVAITSNIHQIIYVANFYLQTCFTVAGIYVNSSMHCDFCIVSVWTNRDRHPKKKGLDKKRCCFCQNGRTFFGEGVAGLQCKTSIHFVSSLPDDLRDSSGLMQRGSTVLARQKSQRALWRRPRLQSFIAQREAEACAETWQKPCDKQVTEQGKSPLRSPKEHLKLLITSCLHRGSKDWVKALPLKKVIPAVMDSCSLLCSQRGK